MNFNQSKRDFLGTGIKGGTAIALTSLIGTESLLSLACNTDDVLKSAKTVVRAIQDSLPYFQQLPNSVGIVKKIGEAIDIGNKFIQSFQDKDISTGVKLAETLIAAFQDIATSTKLFPIPTQVTVLAILGLGNIALHIIVDWADANKSSVHGFIAINPSVLAKAEAFRKEEVWGKKLNH